VRSKSALRVLFGLALVALLAACSGGGSSSPAPGAQTVNLNALDNFKYDPNTFAAKVGQPVHVVMANKGVLEHSLVIDPLNVKLEHVQGGATNDVTFTPPRSGTYVFYCNTPGHKEAGMTGTLVVNP
jgi:uncharacterized cupredoxin-like copper-binding protein